MAIERIVVVGTGHAATRGAPRFRGRGIAVAFVSRDLERARAATAELGGPVERAATRLEDTLGWAQAVYVATPPAAHGEAVLTGATSGLPVLVEKPVEATLERARALEAALGAAAARVTVAENFALLPVLSALREEKLERARIVFHRARPPRGWRTDRALAGGGPLQDVGIHHVSFLRALLGELTVERASASGVAGGVESAIVAAGRSAAGVEWELDLSWSARRRRSEVRLETAGGVLRFRPGRRWLWRTTRRGLPLGVSRLSGDALGEEAVVSDWLTEAGLGRRGRVTLADGIADLVVVDAAYRLAELTSQRPASP